MPSRSEGLAVGALVAIFLVALGSRAGAAETATSDLVIISEDDTVEDDLYAAGLKVVVEGVVEGDLLATAAEEVVISGEVRGSVIAVTPSVSVSGVVGGSVRAVGSRLDITGTVGRDVVASVIDAGLGPESTVTGDVLVYAFGLAAAGSVGGNLEGTQARLRLEGEVSGDVDVTVGRMTITGPLTVGGDLGYRSPQEAEGMGQATVEGTVAHKTPLPPNIRVRALALLTRFLVVIGLTAAALLVAWGWPERTASAASAGRARPLGAYWRGALVTFMPLLIAGVAALVVVLAPATASLPLLAIFAPLVLLTASIVLVLSLVAGAPAVLTLGHVIPGKRGIYASIVLGSMIVGLAWLIPIVGWLVPFVVVPFGLGSWILGWPSSESVGIQSLGEVGRDAADA
jgi:hypothetical protein